MQCNRSEEVLLEWVGPNLTAVLTKEDLDAGTKAERTSCEHTEELGVMCLQAKEPKIASKLLEAQGKAWSRSSLTTSGGANPADTMSQTFSLQN